jgi:cell wall-associated NlpC family hydrolase
MKPAMKKLDSRLNAYRADTADANLEGQVDSMCFVTPQVRQVIEPIVSIHKSPLANSMQLTQALMGETVKVFAEEDGWVWLQLVRDGYVGYAKSEVLSATPVTPTHRVAVPSTFLYSGPNLKSQPAVAITMNAMVRAIGETDKFSQLSDGRFVFTEHLKPCDHYEADFVAVAEMFRHAPYYWGGKSVYGLDCSGLVQLSLEASGIAALRDCDMQENTLGFHPMINDLDSFKRGDLVFWDGHVGIMTDASVLLHANGHHMMVVAEPLKDAVSRIAARYGQITNVKRLQ